MRTRTLAPLIGATTALLLPLALLPTAASAAALDRAGAPPALDSAATDRPIVIGHRGASGYRPEHTLAAYKLAIRQCADYIEPDLVSTRDGVLVARHENEISGTTDVEDRRRFADRRTTKVIDGVSVTGFFTEDFSLKELRTLRAEERIPDVRPANTAYDGRYRVPTLAEVAKLARRSTTCDGDPVGLYPETKHPTYFDSIGLSLEEPLVATLERFGYAEATDPVFLQSFEVGNLQDLDTMTDLSLVQLAGCSGRPFDDPRSYAELMSPAGLSEVATYAEGIGPCKDLIIPRAADGTLGEPTTLTTDAHAEGLLVHGYTFRAENRYLSAEFRSGDDPNQLGDLAGEFRAFLDAGMDGGFSDHPDLAAAALREAAS